MARDAATKEYVDSQATGELGWILKLQIRGRTISRAISKLNSLENFGALVVTYLPADTARIVSVRPGVYGLTAPEPTILTAEVSVATDADLLAPAEGVLYFQMRLNSPLTWTPVLPGVSIRWKYFLQTRFPTVWRDPLIGVVITFRDGRPVARVTESTAEARVEDKISLSSISLYPAFTLVKILFSLRPVPDAYFESLTKDEPSGIS